MNIVITRIVLIAIALILVYFILDKAVRYRALNTKLPLHYKLGIFLLLLAGTVASVALLSPTAKGHISGIYSSYCYLPFSNKKDENRYSVAEGVRYQIEYVVKDKKYHTHTGCIDPIENYMNKEVNVKYFPFYPEKCIDSVTINEFLFLCLVFGIIAPGFIAVRLGQFGARS